MHIKLSLRSFYFNGCMLKNWKWYALMMEPIKSPMSQLYHTISFMEVAGYRSKKGIQKTYQKNKNHQKKQ